MTLSTRTPVKLPTPIRQPQEMKFINPNTQTQTITVSPFSANQNVSNNINVPNLEEVTFHEGLSGSLESNKSK